MVERVRWVNIPPYPHRFYPMEVRGNADPYVRMEPDGTSRSEPGQFPQQRSRVSYRSHPALAVLIARVATATNLMTELLRNATVTPHQPPKLESMDRLVEAIRGKHAGPGHFHFCLRIDLCI